MVHRTRIPGGCAARSAIPRPPETAPTNKQHGIPGQLGIGGLVWFGKSALKPALGPRLVCGDLKLERASPSRRPSGSAEPHPWPHFPICVGWNHSRSPTNDRSRIRRLPLLGNPPRPSPARPQRHSSWAAASPERTTGPQAGHRPPPGSRELPLHPRPLRATSKEHRQRPSYGERRRGTADCSTYPRTMCPSPRALHHWP